MKKEKTAVIQAAYEVTDTHEISVDFDGFSYLVIFGSHINGGFIAIINHGICCEASSPDNISYNVERLIRAGMARKPAQEVATSIAAYASASCCLKEDRKDVLC